MFIISLLIQLLVLIVAMVMASLILRWILAHPEKCRSAWRRTRRIMSSPWIRIRALRAYLNWRKVGMNFSFGECTAREWQKYDRKDTPDQPYYRL